MFLDAPYCKPNQVQVFGVARGETARIACEVISNPVSSVVFEWRFNTSGETVDMPHDRFRSTNSRSVVEYVPRTELDYGSLLCWASNSIGRMRDPCIFHLVPAGVPDNLKNCSIGNQTTSSLQVRKTEKHSIFIVFYFFFLSFSDFCFTAFENMFKFTEHK